MVKFFFPGNHWINFLCFCIPSAYLRSAQPFATVGVFVFFQQFTTFAPFGLSFGRAARQLWSISFPSFTRLSSVFASLFRRKRVFRSKVSLYQRLCRACTQRQKQQQCLQDDRDEIWLARAMSRSATARKNKAFRHQTGRNSSSSYTF